MTKSLSFSLLAVVLLAMGCGEAVPEPKAAPAPIAPNTAVIPAAQPVPVAAGAVTDPNPAHGAPGHRCEIPVGASLSSAPAPGAVQPAPAQSPITTTIPAPGPADAANVPTAPGMNPPHGQPGHDCAVAVGSPLPK